MGTVIEDLHDHEGYGGRRLPDGTLTGVWSAETAKFEAYVASCGCGWHGGHHPPTEAGYESAVEEWEADHARPLLAEAIPDTVRTAINDAKRAVADLIAQRPEAARRALHEVSVWSEHQRRVLESATLEPAADRMRTRLDGLACRDLGRALER